MFYLLDSFLCLTGAFQFHETLFINFCSWCLAISVVFRRSSPVPIHWRLYPLSLSAVTLMIIFWAEWRLLSFPLFFCVVMTFIELNCLISENCGIKYIHKHGEFSSIRRHMEWHFLRYYKSLRCNFQHRPLYHKEYIKFYQLYVLHCKVSF